MTPVQKKIFKLLIAGNYMVITQNLHGRKCWKIYDAKQNPVMYAYHLKKPLKDVLKQDKKGRITLNLSLIRQEHGSSFMKTFYNQNKKSK